MTINDHDATERVAKVLEQRLGAENVRPTGHTTASEDFSVITRAWHVPLVYWAVGGADPQEYAEAERTNSLNKIPSNHSPEFAPVINPTLRTGHRGDARRGRRLAHAGRREALRRRPARMGIFNAFPLRNGWLELEPRVVRQPVEKFNFGARAAQDARYRDFVVAPLFTLPIRRGTSHGHSERKAARQLESSCGCRQRLPHFRPRLLAPGVGYSANMLGRDGQEHRHRIDSDMDDVLDDRGTGLKMQVFVVPQTANASANRSGCDLLINAQPDSAASAQYHVSVQPDWNLVMQAAA